LGNAIHDTTIRNGIVIASASPPAPFNLYSLSAVNFARASQRMTIEGLKIQLSSDPDNLGNFLAVGPNSVLRANIVSIIGAFNVDGFTNSCPSLIIENVFANVNLGISANLGCIAVNNLHLNIL
jgi:hypothetical protein